MIPDQGFTDLRLNRQQGQTDDGFWPSFTDIMTVIVMIFLLAMVILLIRNMDLVEQLRAAVLAERQAAEQARSSGAERETLQHRLTGAERELAQLRADKLRLEALTRRQEAEIADKERQLAALGGEHDRLQARYRETGSALDDLRGRYQTQGAELEKTRRTLADLQQHSRTQATELTAVRQDLDDLKRRYADLEQSRADTRAELVALQRRHGTQTQELDAARQVLERVRTRYAESHTELEALRRDRQAYVQLQDRHRVTEEELETLRRKLAIGEQALAQALGRLKSADLELSELKQDYGDLKIRYDDLVKPARSPEGRYLVEVLYFKAGGKSHLSYKEPADAKFHDVTREQLESRLQTLEAGHPEGLYVKVIFPEESGLSYSEAWRFTSGLHKKYDYYYRTEREQE